MFVRKAAAEIQGEFTEHMQKDVKELKKLTDKKEYLERQAKSCEENLKGILGGENNEGDNMTTL